MSDRDIVSKVSKMAAALAMLKSLGTAPFQR